MQKVVLLQTLHELARQDVWAISGRALGRLLDEPAGTLSVSLARASRDGLIERLAGGFYRNPMARLPAHHLERLAGWLRPADWFYLSLESVLHEAGWLPQVPNRLTFMTTGRSYVYRTPLGVLEFIHTSRTATGWLPDVQPDWQRGIYVASARRAHADLRRVRRNLDLVAPAESH
jgi:hypothetical protein